MALRWIKVTPETFDLYNVNEQFERLPRDVASATSSTVAAMAKSPAGGRIRFKTDSANIDLRAMMKGTKKGVGFDLYRIENGMEIAVSGYRRPECFILDGLFEAEKSVGNAGVMRSFTLNFPYIGQIESLEIGLDEDARLERGDRYRNEKPVIFYGSSITQGAWASRPGLAYEPMISQRWNLNYINFGFSGGARGEKAIADYMASLDMSAFVLDYDHNAPSAEHLEATHLPLFRTIRAVHPDIPILIVTKPDFFSSPRGNQQRADVIRRTYEYAAAQGDEKVWFIDGKTLFAGDYLHNCTLDGCHPNDIGFYRMASVIGPVLARALVLPVEPFDFF